MLTHWRTQRSEEDLYDEQLLDRMDRLDKEAACVKSYQDGEMRLQATEAQVRYAPTLKDYFQSLWGIARESLQLTIIDDLKAVPIAELKEVVKSWWEETNEKSLRYRKVRNFVLQESAEEAKEEIDRLRSLIAPKLMEIVQGLSAFKFGTGFEFWPFLVTDGQELKPIAVTSANSVVAEPEQPIKNKTGSDFVNLLAGVIYGLVAENLRPTWQNVSRRIQVGQAGEAKEDKTHLLPADFQERIADSQFAGNLYDLLVREKKRFEDKDKRPTDEQAPPDTPLKPIDFILRFQRHLWKALAMTGHGKKRPRRLKIMKERVLPEGRLT
jgi:hypothetical protein